MLKRQPGRLEICRRLADLALAVARPADALTALQEGRELRQSPEALVVLGQVHGALGQTAEARAAYEASRKLLPENPDAYGGLGRLFLDAGRHAEARQAFMAVTFWDPRRADAHVSHGLAALRAGSRDAAESAFQAALRVAPEHRPARLQLGLLAEAAGRPTDALRWLRAAAGEMSTVEARLALARVYTARGDRSAAFRERGLYFRERGLKARAAATYAAWIAAFPDDVEARMALSEVEAEMNHLPRALAVAEAGLKRLPREPALHERVAEGALATGRRERAAAACRSWLRLKPRAAGPCRMMGRLALAAGRETEAIRRLEEAAARAPDDAGVLRELGEALARLPSRADRERAAARLQRAVALAPGDASCRYAWALALQALGRMEEARSQLLRALDLDPRHLPALRRVVAIARSGGLDEPVVLWARLARREAARRQAEARLWQETWDRPKAPAGYLALARHLIQRGGLRPAQSQIEEALRLRRELPEAAALRDTVTRVLAVL
jgi:tetratricopeptide (TPR) repeat protein